MTKSASFDVIGTCFEFSAPIQAIETHLGSKLKNIAVDPKTLFFSWFYAAQRDFTYVSMNGAYVPIAQVLKSTFRRACAVVDLPMNVITDEDVGEVMKAFKSMGPREGLKRCIDGLRGVRWDVYGVTNGGSETSLGYYHSAGIDLDEEHLVSCDAIQVAKPDVRVYENANKHLTSMGLKEEDGQRWFVAAHAWDLIAARKAGFKTAYLDFEEHDPCTDVFGKFDLYATSMDDLLAKLKELD
ncbi:2-haloalkanoic acid dehalogenase [Pyrenophora seminiperda CCB06]|uniref:2-haloalkanoic acid dehalogenase n=1 Tax=Pyrenophora seminiperda CCB06 TaxID=1302712 RepID=A0A3M7M6G5_9PLEO|nr:2-haloalkanoic acid dehalogenase [Pyrenophora seminiperda CCB06]